MGSIMYIFCLFGIIYLVGILAKLEGRSPWLWQIITLILTILGPFLIPLPFGILEGLIIVNLYWFIANLSKDRNSLLVQIRKKIRIFYLNRTENPRKIIDIIQNDPYEEVKKKAVEKLNRIKYLKRIAQNNPSARVREEAIKSIKAAGFLKNVIKNDPNEKVKRRALSQLDKHHPNDEERNELRDQLFIGEL